jgi:hypothetical protein
MKKFLIHLALAILLVSVPGVARADIIIVTQLSGAGELPPTSSPALGTATFTINSAMTEIDFTISFGADVGSQPLTSPLQAGHIHFGMPGINGPVILPFPNLPAGATSGTFAGILTASNLTPVDPILTFADAVAALEAGDTYTNLHTTNFPGGEIRGQNPAAAPVPEPSALILVGVSALGLLTYGWWRRK